MEIMEKTKVSIKQSTILSVYLFISVFASVFAVYSVIIPLNLKSTAVNKIIPGQTVASASMINQSRQKQAVDQREQERLHRLLEADKVIIGKVEKKENIAGEINEKLTASTKYLIKNLELLKGSGHTGETVTLNIPGGIRSDGKTVAIQDMPNLKEGWTYVLFLDESGGISPFAGGADGVYPIFRAANNMPIVTDLRGRPITPSRQGFITQSVPQTLSEFLASTALVVSFERSHNTDLILTSLPGAGQDQMAGEENIQNCNGYWLDQPIQIETNWSFNTSRNPDGSSQYNAMRSAAEDYSGLAPGSLNLSVNRNDDYPVEPYYWLSNNWYPGFQSSEILFGNMKETGYCENSDVGGVGKPCWTDDDCLELGTQCIDYHEIMDGYLGQASCLIDQQNRITAAVVAMNIRDYSWFYQWGNDHITTLEQLQDRSGYNYKTASLHELGHSTGQPYHMGSPPYQNYQGNDELTVMTEFDAGLPKLWGFDQRFFSNHYLGEPSEVNIFASNFKFYSNTVMPVDIMGNQYHAGEQVSYEYTVGHNGKDNVSFLVGVYLVLDGWEQSQNSWILVDSFNVNLTQENTTQTDVRTFRMPHRSGYLMVYADPLNSLAESDEYDNGQHWPRLSYQITPVDGGWLYAETGNEYGGDYNTIRLTVDSYGPPVQAELYYSTTPYDGTQGWFNQAQQANLPDNFPADYQPNAIKYLNLSGLQNEQYYSVVLRQIRNGYTEWEVDYTDGVDTHACTIQVGSPNGGEELLSGDPAELTWTRAGRCTANVKIQLLRNGTVCSTIAANTPNDRKHAWTVSQCSGASDNYKIKVQDIGAGVADESNAMFIITVHQSSDVRNPSFEWDYGNDFFPNYDMDNRTAGDMKPDGWRQSSWPGLMDNIEKHTGQYSARLDRTENNSNRAYLSEDIPVVNGKSYRISGWVKTACLDNDCFGTITTECLKSDHSNKWTGCGLNLPEGNIARVTGFSDWQYIEFNVTADTPEAAYLRVLCYNSPNQNGLGLGTVWCDDLSVTETNQSGSISVTRPNGGEVFEPGDDQQTTWNKSGDVGYSFRIELYQNDVFCKLIEPSTSFSPYTWRQIIGCSGQEGNYKVKISSNLHPEISDTSNAPFAIKPLKVTYPDDGVTLTVGGSEYILWNRADNMGANVKIELLRNGSVCRTIAASAPNVGAYTWTNIAQCNNQTTGYAIKITDPTTGATATGTTFNIQQYIPSPPDDDGSSDNPPKNEDTEQGEQGW